MSEVTGAIPALAEHKTSEAFIKDNIVPIITPKTKSGEVDVRGIENLLSFHANSLGTRALFAVGGLGRFHELTDRQRIQAAEAFLASNKKLGSPFLVFLGATSETPESTLSNLEKFASLGADVVFFAPLFFLAPDEISDFVKKARISLGPKIPLLVYNNPAFSKGKVKNIDPIILRDCSDCISAIKDSSCDDGLFGKYASMDEVVIYTGNEPTLVEAVKKRGSRGCVGGIGNVSGTAAELARELAKASVDDDDDGEEDEMKVAELTTKFDREIATLKKVLGDHPGVDSGDMMSAIYHFCLGHAGILEPQEDLMKYLTERDKAYLRESILVPERKRVKRERQAGVENGGGNYKRYASATE